MILVGDFKLGVFISSSLAKTSATFSSSGVLSSLSSVKRSLTLSSFETSALSSFLPLPKTSATLSSFGVLSSFSSALIALAISSALGFSSVLSLDASLITS